MALSDAQFRIGVVGAAIALAATMTIVRFCGSVELPAKPPRPAPVAHRTTTELIGEGNAAPAVYQDYLAKDARLAGVAAPSYDDMTRALPYRVDAERQVLDAGAPAIDKAGLRIQARRIDDALVLEIENPTDTDLAYLVATEPVPRAACGRGPTMAFNAMVIGRHQREVRVECAWRPELAVAVRRVETLAVSPLSAWYLSQVPPALVGIEDRIARGHRRAKGAGRCDAIVSQVVRARRESGEIGWRDLADFYARHRCQTYQFPDDYRAITRDGERRIPAQ